MSAVFARGVVTVKCAADKRLSPPPSARASSACAPRASPAGGAKAAVACVASGVGCRMRQARCDHLSRPAPWGLPDSYRLSRRRRADLMEPCTASANSLSSLGSSLSVSADSSASACAASTFCRACKGRGDDKGGDAKERQEKNVDERIGKERKGELLP